MTSTESTEVEVPHSNASTESLAPKLSSEISSPVVEGEPTFEPTMVEDEKKALSEVTENPMSPLASSPYDRAVAQSEEVTGGGSNEGSTASVQVTGDERAIEKDLEGGEGGELEKKRRRRRKRKKAEGGDSLAASDGEASAEAEAEGHKLSEGAYESGSQNSKKREKQKRSGAERERPPFGVGDIVFGKVIEITDEVMFIDLSGKAKALFDLRELFIPDEEVREAKEAAAAEKAEREAEKKRQQNEQWLADGMADKEGSSLSDDPHDPHEGSGEAFSAADETLQHGSEHDRSNAAGGAEPLESGVEDEGKAHVQAARAEGMASAGGEGRDGAADQSGQPSGKLSGQLSVEKDEHTDVEAHGSGPHHMERSEGTEGTVGAKGTERLGEGDGVHLSTEAHLEVEGSTSDRAAQPQLPRVILEPGAQFVGVVRNDGSRGGYVVVTHHPERISRTRPLVAHAARENSMVFGIVTGVIKGGVDVDVDGLRAFAPASHVDLKLGAKLDYLVGKRLGFFVTQYGKRGRDVVLSRKLILEGEAKERRESALAKLQAGQVAQGVVRTVTTFGAFIDLDGVEGLVSLSEMSHNRSDKPHDLFKVGDLVQVKVLKIDERGKIWLSRKATLEDPWAHVAAKYPVGSKHMGRIARLQSFGAFVELESGIDGLVHISDLSLKHLSHPSDLVKEGDEIEVVVAHLDLETHKISLHPALTGEQAQEPAQKVQKDKTVKAVVVNADSTGLYLRIMGVTGRQARGFIPPGGTGTPRGTELKKAFPVGKQLDAKIQEIDPRRGEIKLSIKALSDENERNAFQAYRAQVKREAKFGTFADLFQRKTEK